MKHLFFVLFLFAQFTLFCLLLTLLSLLFRFAFDKLREVEERKDYTEARHHRKQCKINFFQVVRKMRVEYKISARQEQNRKQFNNNIADILEHVKFKPG